MFKPLIVSCAILTIVAGIGAARAAEHAQCVCSWEIVWKCTTNFMLC